MTNEITGTLCEIRCLHCGKWFNSGLHFGNAEAYFSTATKDNTQQCTHCKKITPMNKDNMRFGERRADGRITYVEGKDTM